MSARSKSNPRKRNVPPAPRTISDTPSALARRLSWIGFCVVLLFTIAWPLTNAYLVDAVTVRLCTKSDQSIPPEKRVPVFLNEIAFDGYVWNRHAEKLGENGNWRLRTTDLDNAPEGREVHWNSAFAWYLRGLGELRRLQVDEPLRHAIFRMSIWANPILLVFAILFLSTLSARRFGPFCGSILALGMVAVPTFYEGFMPAYPDHHGLIAFCLLGLLFGIAWAGAGWVREDSSPPEIPSLDLAPRDLPQARHGMIFSAVCGAAGLWISALSTTMVLGTIGISILLTVVFWGNRLQSKSSGVRFHPELWRIWTLWGAGASLAFYLLEYFPFHMGLRLEVNHPLYALAWWGGGWILATLTAWWITQESPSRRSLAGMPWRKLILPFLAVLPLPLLILLGGPEIYLPKDPFMGRLWKNIAELLPLLTRIEQGGLTWAVALGWFPLLLLATGFLQFSKKTRPGNKAILLFMAFPILLMTALQFYQVRWGMLVGPLYLALAALVLPQVWRILPQRLIPRLVGFITFIGVGFLFVQPSFTNAFKLSWEQYRADPDQTPLTPGQALALIHRQMAVVIAMDAGDEPVVLLSSPNSSCLLATLGGFRTVGTLYWENVAGLKKAAGALNAQTEPEALELLQRLGVTHVSFITWENFIEPFFRILHPDSSPSRSFGNSFGKRALFDRVIPPWTRPLLFPHNPLTTSLKQQVLLLRIAPGQTPLETRLHLARFLRLVENNPAAAKELLQEILRQYPDNPDARLELNELGLPQKTVSPQEAAGQR